MKERAQTKRADLCIIPGNLDAAALTKHVTAVAKQHLLC